VKISVQLSVQLSVLSSPAYVSGHEYTNHLLTWAQTIEPDNEHMKQKLQWANAVLAKGEPTVPSTIGEELQHNPFMRGMINDGVNRSGCLSFVCSFSLSLFLSLPELVSNESVAKAVGASTSNPIEVMRALRAQKDNVKM
jgi:hypothetical protein